MLDTQISDTPHMNIGYTNIRYNTYEHWIHKYLIYHIAGILNTQISDTQHSMNMHIQHKYHPQTYRNPKATLSNFRNYLRNFYSMR